MKYKVLLEKCTQKLCKPHLHSDKYFFVISHLEKLILQTLINPRKCNSVAHLPPSRPIPPVVSSHTALMHVSLPMNPFNGLPFFLLPGRFVFSYHSYFSILCPNLLQTILQSLTMKTLCFLSSTSSLLSLQISVICKHQSTETPA